MAPWDQTFDARAISPWQTPSDKPTMVAVAYQPPNFDDNEILKEAFGIELGKGVEPFKAGLETFNGDVAKSLWASLNWLTDAIVIASRDAYLKTVKALEKPLDREQLLAKVLAFADERTLDGVPLVEAKERLNALKLYSDISGFTGKIDINASTNTVNETTNNFMSIKLVKGIEPKVVEASNSKSEILNDVVQPINLKLVGGTSR